MVKTKPNRTKPSHDKPCQQQDKPTQVLRMSYLKIDLLSIAHTPTARWCVRALAGVPSQVKSVMSTQIKHKMK